MNTIESTTCKLACLDLTRTESTDLVGSHSPTKRSTPKSFSSTLIDGTECKEEVLTETPVIGVLTAIRDYGDYTSYIMGAYIKFVEQTGAKVVPIFQTDSDENTAELMKKINGVIFPGGASKITDEEKKLTMYGRKFKFILDKTKEMNANGTHFPILGICLGLQAIPVVETLDASTLDMDKFDSVDTSDNLIFKMNPRKTRQFRNMPQYLLEAIQTEEITYNSHHDGVYPSVFKSRPELKDWNVVATTYDRVGVEYVATVEHKKYPIYAHQFHPEKIQFIFKEGLNIPRTDNTMDLARYMAEFFAHECRLNSNKFDSDEEKERTLINNYPKMDTGTVSQDIYGFNEELMF